MDRYRALLAGRYAAVTSLAAAVVDRGTALRHAARRASWRRRRRLPTGPRLVRAAVGGDVMSLVVAGSAHGALTLRNGSRSIDLAATTDAGATTVRYVATLPDDAADGTEWTVAVGAAGLVVTDPDLVPRGFSVVAGLLVLHAPPASGVEHTLEVGVRTAVVRWSGAGTRLTVSGREFGTRQPGCAEVDLADVEPGPALVDGVPLVLRAGRWPTDARPAVPPPVRVLTPGARLEIGYDAEGSLEFRAAPATTAAWS